MILSSLHFLKKCDEPVPYRSTIAPNYFIEKIRPVCIDNGGGNLILGKVNLYFRYGMADVKSHRLNFLTDPTRSNDDVAQFFLIFPIWTG